METDTAATVIHLDSQTKSALSGLDQVLRWGINLIILLSPILVLPITTDWFDGGKQLFLTLATGLLAVIFLLRALLRRKLALTRSAFDLPLALFLLVSAVSALLTYNQIINLQALAVTTFPLTLLYFLITNVFHSEDDVKHLINWLLGGAVLVSVLTIFQGIIYLASRLPSPSLVEATTNLTTRLPFLLATFSPTGTIFTQAVFLALVLPVGIGLLLRSKQSDSAVTTANYTAVVAIVALALLATIFQLFQNRPFFLDLDSSWKIATGTMGQSLSSALFGNGQANYLNAFSLYKPITINAQPYWSLRFAAAFNHLLFILTNLGIAGLAALIFLMAKILRTIKIRLDGGTATQIEQGLFLSLGLALGLFLVVPAPLVFQIVFLSLLAALVVYYKSKGAGSFAGEYHAPWLSQTAGPAVGLVAIIALAMGANYLSLRFYLADWHYAQSLATAAQNRGTDTYNLQIQTINENPWNDVYRVAYSQTNLALADSLAGSIAASPSAQTDKQKATVIELVQQSIREGRNAVALNPRSSADWENLAAIYRALINFAQGADQWSVASINQAIALDPVNPTLRLELGNIFFGLGNYITAGQAFSLAAQLKPDYVTAHYDLAQAYRKLGDNQSALSELSITKNLVCAISDQSPDCQRVSQELAVLQQETAKSLEKPQEATPSAKPTETKAGTGPVASPSALPTNFPKVRPQPTPQISSPSGELRP